MRENLKARPAVLCRLLPAWSLPGWHNRESSPTRGAAFTLVEIMVVLVVVIILISLAVPATTSLLRGLQVGQAGQLIDNQMDLARQAALSKNRSVEVRICRPVGGKFSAILPLLVSTAPNPNDATKPNYQSVGKPSFIPQSVIIDSGATLSTLASPNGTAPGLPDTANTTNPPLGGLGQNYEYVSFRFKPDGTTNLQASKLWFLTIHNASDGDALPNSPLNYYTVQIDPYSGHVTQFRP